MSQLTPIQKSILKAIKAEFRKINREEDMGFITPKPSKDMEPLSEVVYDSLPEYEDHPSEYYDKLLNES